MRAISLSLCVVIVLAYAPVIAAQEAEYQIVVHPSYTGSTVAKTEVKRIFLKQRSKWSTGEKADPVDQKSAEIRGAFGKDVLRKNLKALDSYWQGQVFAAKSTPPPMLAGDREVVTYVRSNPGAVGYVSAGADTSGVKVVTIAD